MLVEPNRTEKALIKAFPFLVFVSSLFFIVFFTFFVLCLLFSLCALFFLCFFTPSFLSFFLSFYYFFLFFFVSISFCATFFIFFDPVDPVADPVDPVADPVVIQLIQLIQLRRDRSSFGVSPLRPYSGTTKLSVETIVVFNTVANLHGTYVLEMDQIQNYSYDSNLDDNSMVIGVVSDNLDTLYHPTYQNSQIAPVEQLLRTC